MTQQAGREPSQRGSRLNGKDVGQIPSSPAMQEKPFAARRSERGSPMRLHLWTWLLGPATFSSCVGVTWFFAGPGELKPPAGLDLFCMAILGQIVAIVLFLSTLSEFRGHIRSVAWWILAAYWVAIGGIVGAFVFELSRTFIFGCGWCCIAAAALVLPASFADWVRSRASDEAAVADIEC